eukprot:m.35967 g.35967  ORF g.35967 m.35967 type:complete len:58 (-) comp11214_c0_seq1:115-288(-)
MCWFACLTDVHYMFEVFFFPCFLYFHLSVFSTQNPSWCDATIAGFNGPLLVSPRYAL